MAREVLDHGVVLPAEYSDNWYEDMTSNLQKLDEVIGSDGDKLSAADVANVAISGDYDDLTNKPSYGILRMTSETLSDSGSGAISNLNSDSKLAAGDYVLDAALKVFPIAAVSASSYTVGTSLFQITNASALAAVATSGSYDDLNNLPAYGITRFVNAAISDNSSVAFSAISSTDKIKVGDFLLDTNGKLYQISAVDMANETVSVTTPLTQLAVDSGVMHLSGNETAAGIKTFSDDTFIKSLNFTNEVPSQSSSSSSIMPIITTITYGDSSPSVQARLNVRITADGTKSFYPHENNQYSLGLVSRRWSTFFGYLFNVGGAYLGNEASTNQRTNLYLLANRDTDGQSGAYITRFRQNKSQGALNSTDLQMIGFDVLENTVRTSNVFNILCTDWLNDVPQKVNFISSAQSYSFGTSARKALFNNINPGSLSLPDLSNGIDISGFITNFGAGTVNEYTPIADGWISIANSGDSPIFIRVYNDYGFEQVVYSERNEVGGTTGGTYTRFGSLMIPCVKNIKIYIIVSPSTSVLVSAKFYPCQGNV